MEVVDGKWVELVCGCLFVCFFLFFFLHLHLVVASCSNNEILSANYGVLGAVVTSTFGHWFMVPFFNFNIKNVQPLPYLYFYIITYTKFGFK